MLFEQKKIQLETLGEYLTVVRNNLNLSLEQVSSKTGIKLKFLELLEKGDFQALPSLVYVAGFLRQLAKYYSVDFNELLAQYKKERGIQEQLAVQSRHNNSSWYQRWFGRVVVTPKLLSLLLGIALVCLTVFYLIWQVWSINKTPTLNVFQPANNAVTSSAFMDVVGQTDAGMAVSVNGQPIFVDNKGGFNTQIGIGPGPTQITVTSENRFGKAVTQTLNITSQATTTPIAGNVILKLDFKAPVVLGLVLDDQPAQTLNFSSGDSKTFTASQKILLSTSDAGATFATLNGQPLGPMGKSKEQLNNISFYPQASSSSLGK